MRKKLTVQIITSCVREFFWYFITLQHGNQIFTCTYDSILWYTTNVRSPHVSIIYLSWSKGIEFSTNDEELTKWLRKVQKGTIHYGTMVEPWYRYKIMERFLSLSATGRAIRDSASAQLWKIVPRLNDFIEIREPKEIRIFQGRTSTRHMFRAAVKE